jgi:hypothetical protein
VRHQNTEQSDFDCDNVRSAEELRTLWEKAKNVFLNARDCKHGSRDENAWYDDDVVRPPLHLAMDMYCNGKWWLQTVYVSFIAPSTTL